MWAGLAIDGELLVKSNRCRHVIAGMSIAALSWVSVIPVWSQDSGTTSVFALPEKKVEQASQPDPVPASESIFKLPEKKAVSEEKSPFLLPPAGDARPGPPVPALTVQDQDQDPGELLEAANAMAKKGDNEEAGKMYSRVLELDPTNVKAMNNLGIVLKRLGRHEDALQAYHYAIQTDEAYPLTHKNMGILLEVMNDPDGAITAYERYIELAPSAPDSGAVKERLNWLKQ